MPCKEQINNIMSALLQETEDFLKRAEQQCILNQQWQELVVIQHKRTELLNVSAFLLSLAAVPQFLPESSADMSALLRASAPQRLGGRRCRGRRTPVRWWCAAASSRPWRDGRG